MHGIIISLIMIGIGSIANAEEVPEHFQGVRPLGMGGAHTAVASDENAVWTNPAGIARVRKARSRKTLHVLTFPNVIAGANAESRAFNKAYKSSQEKNVETVLLENAESFGENPLWARAAIYPVALFDVARGVPMSFGVYSNTTMKITVNPDDTSEADIKAIGDGGAVLGFAFTNATNRFSIGIQGRPVVRYAYEDTVATSLFDDRPALQEQAESLANTYQGVGVDFGMIWTFADFWFPTLGISVLNLPTGCKEDFSNPFSQQTETVCGNVYKGDIQNDQALSSIDPTDVRVGFAITPRLGRKVAVRFAFDAHHLVLTDGTKYYGYNGIDAGKLLHGGMELFIGNPLLVPPFALRAGYNQGFVTYGSSIKLPFMSLEFASYGADVSSTASQVEDRRYIGSFSFEF